MGCVYSGLRPRTELGESFISDYPILNRDAPDIDEWEISKLNKTNTKPVFIANENKEPVLDQKVCPSDFVFLRVLIANTRM
jgi:hypothetical protein